MDTLLHDFYVFHRDSLRTYHVCDTNTIDYFSPLRGHGMVANGSVGSVANGIGFPSAWSGNKMLDTTAARTIVFSPFQTSTLTEQTTNRLKNCGEAFPFFHIHDFLLQVIFTNRARGARSLWILFRIFAMDAQPDD